MIKKKMNAVFTQVLKFVFFLLPAFMMLNSCLDRAHEQKELRKVWRNYTEAFANKIGTECVKYIDTASINYYSDVLTLINNADSEAIDRLYFDEKMAVLIVRHTATLEVVRKMSGRSLFEYLVQTGIGGSQTNGYTLKIISLSDIHAVAQLIDTANQPGLTITFNKENGAWKVNLVDMARRAGEIWPYLIREKGYTEHEFLTVVLKIANDKEPSNKIWHPMVPESL